MNQNELFEALLKADTPTVCNALEIVMGGRTAEGFTKGPVIPIDPELPAFVGYAVTARLRASAPADIDSAAVLRRRLDYYRMVGEAAATRPTVVVIEDTDSSPGVGAYKSDKGGFTCYVWAANYGTGRLRVCAGCPRIGPLSAPLHRRSVHLGIPL